MERSLSEAQVQIAFVERALQSLHGCRVAGVDQFAKRWFVHGFNHWYCPVVRRGFSGPMAPVFDIGVLLVEPAVMLESGSDGYSQFLDLLRASAVLEEAHSILRDAPEETRPQVEWLLVESVLRGLGNVWGDADLELPRFLPRLDREKNDESQVRIWAAGQDEPLKVIASIIPAAAADSFAHLQPIGEASQWEFSTNLRLFMADMACRMPDAVARLDYEVIEACFQASNLRTEEHEPPPLHPTDEATSTHSVRPGPIAGHTRIRVKKPDDPIADVLPSELMLLKKDREAGLANLFYGKPLIIEHEIEKDRVPRHRALICFVVDAYAEAPSSDSPAYARYSAGHRYRHPYVYAKRLVFDLVRDLRDALEVVRRVADVHIDVSIFALPPSLYQTDAVVHRKFPLDQIPLQQRSDPVRDRLVQLRCLGRLAPDFFDRRAVGRHFGSVHRPDPSPRTLVDPHVGQFLRHEAHNGSYRKIHVISIGLLHLPRFVVMARGYFSFESATRYRMRLVAVNMDGWDNDPQRHGTDEPEWQSGEPQGLYEADRLAAGGLPAITLASLRRQIVASVIGEVSGPRTGSRRIVQMANTSTSVRTRLVQ